MKKQGLVIGALAMQLVMSAVAVQAAPTTSAQGAAVTQSVAPRAIGGSSWADIIACAGCIAGGLIAIESGAATLAGAALLIGGPQALAVEAAIVTCVLACDRALE
jgi:hypothetical protein